MASLMAVVVVIAVEKAVKAMASAADATAAEAMAAEGMALVVVRAATRRMSCLGRQRPPRAQ